MQETSEHRGQQASTDPFEGETLTRDYLMVLWERKWLVLGVSLVCGLVGLALSKTSSPTYEAAVKMVLAPSRTGDTAPPLSLPVVRAIAAGLPAGPC